MKRLLLILSISLLIGGCEERIQDTLPGDPNGNLVHDAEKALETKDNVKDATKDQVGDTVDDSVENTVKNIVGGSLGEAIGDFLGDKAGEAAEEQVEKAFGPDFGETKELVEKITGTSISSKAQERFFAATVDEVIDGDTVHITSDSGHSFKLRILYIDSPEDTKKKQKYGEAATAFAKKHLKGKEVTIEVSKKGEPVDKYGRLLGNIFIGDRMYQEMLITEGLAMVRYVYKPDTQYEKYLRSKEKVAEAKRKNIWKTPGYATPDGYDMSVWN